MKILNSDSQCVFRIMLVENGGCLLFVIVVFPDHTHLLFLKSLMNQNWLNSFHANYNTVTGVQIL